MKLNVNKFNKLRDKSKELSKKRDYRLIEHNEGRSNAIEIISNIQDTLRPINCIYLNVGCKLPAWKRDKLKCEECYYR